MDVPGHSSSSVRLAIGWSWLDDWPTVVFEALGRTHEYRPEQRLILRTYDDPHDKVACPLS